MAPYSIHAPIYSNASRQIDYWTLVGASTNIKNSIYFSADSNKQNGALCHSLPTGYPRWEADFIANVRSGSLSFLFSEEPCPMMQYARETNNINGFAIKIIPAGNISYIDFISYHNYQSETKQLCKRNGKEVHLNISTSNSKVSIFTREGTTFQSCGSDITFPRPLFGYFSVIAKSGTQIGDSQLFGIDINIPEDFNESYIQKDILKYAKNMINQQQNVTFVKKTIMNYTAQLLSEIKDRDGILDASDIKGIDYNLIFVIHELENRLKLTVEQPELGKIIDSILMPSLDKIERRIMSGVDTFKQMKGQLNEFLTDVNGKCDWMKQHVFTELNKLKNNSIQTIQSMLNISGEAAEIKRVAKMHKNDAKRQIIPTFLLVFSLIELSCYIGFVIKKHRETNGFKKHD